MPNNFYNILVPVNFSSCSKWAIAKAVELANTFKCNIHLVHVVSAVNLPAVDKDAGFMLAYNISPDMELAGKKLRQLKELYSHHVCSGGKIEISVLYGYAKSALAKYIEQYQIDMVIKGLSQFNLLHRIWSTISISRLVRKTNIPVLAVRSTGLICHFKKIVLPLHDQIPMRRIRLAAMLGRYFKSTIYVLSVRNKNGDHHLPLLNDTLEIIQSLTTIPVQSIILEGKNIAEATLRFSKRLMQILLWLHR